MGNSGFNDTYVTSRYEAWNPKGEKIKEIVTLTNDRKRQFERRGWRFRRTTRYNKEFL